MTELEATIADLRIAVSLTEPGECLDIPRVRVIELLDEIARLRKQCGEAEGEIARLAGLVAELEPIEQRVRHVADSRCDLGDWPVLARHLLGEA